MAKRRQQHEQQRRDAPAAKDPGSGSGAGQPPARPPVEASDPAAAELARARAALSRGDMRVSRQVARSVLAGSPSPAAREEAQRILAGAGLDPAALVAALIVLATILIAAWTALLRRH